MAKRHCGGFPGSKRKREEEEGEKDGMGTKIQPWGGGVWGQQGPIRHGAGRCEPCVCPPPPLICNSSEGRRWKIRARAPERGHGHSWPGC